MVPMMELDAMAVPAVGTGVEGGTNGSAQGDRDTDIGT